MIRFSSVSFRSVSFRFDNERTDARLGERRRDRVDSIRFGSKKRTCDDGRHAVRMRDGAREEVTNDGRS